MSQKSMFEIEDLPLFSGTSPRAAQSPFIPKPQTKLASMSACHFCLDTGYTLDGFCWCVTGQQAREAAQDALAKRILADARQLSSGVMGGLTGYTAYADIEVAQNAFIAWLADHPGFNTWQSAWEAFWPIYSYREEE